MDPENVNEDPEEARKRKKRDERSIPCVSWPVAMDLRKIALTHLRILA